MSCRKVTTGAQKLPADWEEMQSLFVKRLAVLVYLYNVPAGLVLNMDQTGLHLVPASNYTRAKIGSKDVSCIGFDHKSQVTLVPALTADGDLLPFQVR